MRCSTFVPSLLSHSFPYYVLNAANPQADTESALLADEIKQSLLFVTNDDKVYALGDNSYLRLGLGHNAWESPEEVIELSGKRIEQFFVGMCYVLGHSSDGNLYSWGFSSKCPIGRSIACSASYFKPDSIEFFNDIDFDIKQVCCGDNYVLVLLENGVVFMWGHKRGGMDIEIPKEMTIINQLAVISIVNEKSRFFVLNADNKVYSWGQNDIAFLGHDCTETKINSPTIISKLSTVKIIDIKCTSLGVYFLSSEGHIYVCGHSSEYRGPKYPILIETDQKFTQLERIDNKTVVAINDKQIVYELEGMRIIETEFKSFEEYSVRKRGITYKTFKVDFASLMASPDKSLPKLMKVPSLSKRKFKCKICSERKAVPQACACPEGHTSQKNL